MLIITSNFAVLFDGPSGEKASAQDRESLDSLGLGEEEILKMIRANPEKAEKMVEEEEKDEDGSGAKLMRVRQPPSMRSKRAAEIKVKMGKKKKKKDSKQKKLEKTKKKDQNAKSKKRKSVKSKEKKINKKRKLGKKGKHITNKNNNKLERKTKKKIKLISRMKKINQKRKETHGNRQKTKFLGKSAELENCTSLWAELTNIGFGLASSLKKQVMDNAH